MAGWRRLWLVPLTVVSLPLILLLIWLAAALALGAIPARSIPQPSGEDAIEVALVSNGWHVDLVLPLKAGGIDLSRDFAPTGARQDEPPAFIAIGWGDRAFYLETPRLADLKPRTALKALIGASPTVLHVTYLRELPRGDGVRRLKISPTVFAELAGSITRELRRDAHGMALAIEEAGYGASDAFYEAKGHYSPLLTCNEWLAQRLRAAGLPAGLWAPLPSGLIRHWPPVTPSR